jgi:hypothetical protein
MATGRTMAEAIFRFQGVFNDENKWYDSNVKNETINVDDEI